VRDKRQKRTTPKVSFKTEGRGGALLGELKSMRSRQQDLAGWTSGGVGAESGDPLRGKGDYYERQDKKIKLNKYGLGRGGAGTGKNELLQCEKAGKANSYNRQNSFEGAGRRKSHV